MKEIPDAYQIMKTTIKSWKKFQMLIKLWKQLLMSES